MNKATNDPQSDPKTAENRDRPTNRATLDQPAKQAPRPTESEMLADQGKLTRPSESERAADAPPMEKVEQREEPETDGRPRHEGNGLENLQPAGANRGDAVTNGDPNQSKPNRLGNETLREERDNDGGVDGSKRDHMVGSSTAAEGVGHVTDSVTEAMRGTSA